MEAQSSSSHDLAIIGICCMAALCLCYYIQRQYSLMCWCWTLAHLDPSERAEAIYAKDVVHRHYHR